MKIAIVKLSALGDIVHAMVALQFIKARFPDSQIDWLVEARFADLLQDNPHISNILTVNLKAAKTHKFAIFNEIKTVKQYAQANYDLVIDAQGLLKSAITAKILGKNVAGFDNHSIRESLASLFYKQKVACAYDANTIDRNCAVLAEPLDFSISYDEILNKKPFLFFHEPSVDFSHFLQRNLKNILFVIGSTWASRNYPAEKFVQVANALQQNCLVIWGNESEREAAETMAAQSEFIRVLPALNLNDLKALLSQVDLVIGNDTGPTHIAWGLNTPSITLFGCTPISRVYQTPINKVLKSSSMVNPRKLNKRDYSIKDIPPKEIVEMANTLLQLGTC
ncbi:MAG: lipopolysaccharide heptosyltransferase I [Methylococcales bacterium]|nr:lipopolysaccharide heptosyltransferase I [Methylococcales bacterium]